MSTNKPRIQAYVKDSLYQQFEQERGSWGLNQSQALEKMLSERYLVDNTQRDNQFSHSLQKISKELAKLVERVANLEAFNGSLIVDKFNSITSELPVDLPSELESITSELPVDLPSELESVTSELPVDLPSELESVTSELPVDLPSELESITSELPVDLPSELESVTSELPVDLPSELESVTSELPVDLPSELESVTSELPVDLPSELESVTSELPVDLPSELELSKGLSQRALSKRLGCSHPYIKDLVVLGHLAEWSKREDPQGLAWELRGKKYYPLDAKPSDLDNALPGEAEIFIVYEFDNEAGQYRYWSGGYRMFDTSLHLASKYKSEETALKSISAIQQNEAYLRELDKREAGRFKVGAATVEFLAKKRKQLRKPKESAL